MDDRAVVQTLLDQPAARKKKVHSLILILTVMMIVLGFLNPSKITFLIADIKTFLFIPQVSVAEYNYSWSGESYPWNWGRCTGSGWQYSESSSSCSWRGSGPATSSPGHKTQEVKQAANFCWTFCPHIVMFMEPNQDGESSVTGGLIDCPHGFIYTLNMCEGLRTWK